MPTFTAIALDSLLESGAAKSTTKSVSDTKTAPNSNLERRNSASTVTVTKTTVEKKYHWTQISPALYATPEVTPLPDSPSSFPPSPYIINHKRRGPRLLKSFSEDDVASRQRAQEEDKANGNRADAKTEVLNLAKDDSATVDVAVPISVEEHVNGFHVEEVGDSNVANGLAGENDSPKCVVLSSERDGESEDFYDPQESMSMTSNTDGEDNSGTERSMRFTTPMGEFFDAWEELSSEGGPLPSPHDVEAELREIRLSLLMEIEKRKQAEEALNNMQSQWQRIREQLSLVGLTLPADPTVVVKDEQLEFDPAEDLCRQVYLARFVSDCIGRGTAKAEVEMEMEAQIESKNFEIARLCDRLHYYETVNREMSQRNQETVEMGRRERQRMKRRQSWVWGSIAAAITLGSAALLWSYLPAGKESSSAYHSQAPERDDAAK
ncbi:hypothetical protein L1049_023609 [Liquidambar formosana]|uniref:Uncharacterized protein n=1 Tax=Liquidambar formosana TaxID=63359 RepID=A0AAP0RTM4_LIQFO